MKGEQARNYWNRSYATENSWQSNYWAEMWDLAKNSGITIPTNASVIDLGGGTGTKLHAFEMFKPRKLTYVTFPI